MLVVDIRHWLTPDLSLPTDNLRLRRQVLKIARLVEYGGPLPPGHTRETLVECSRRPNRQQCLGLLWVTKQDVETIFAHCLICGGGYDPHQRLGGYGLGGGADGTGRGAGGPLTCRSVGLGLYAEIRLSRAVVSRSQSAGLLRELPRLGFDPDGSIEPSGLYAPGFVPEVTGASKVDQRLRFRSFLRRAPSVGSSQPRCSTRHRPCRTTPPGSRESSERLRPRLPIWRLRVVGPQLRPAVGLPSALRTRRLPQKGAAGRRPQLLPIGRAQSSPPLKKIRYSIRDDVVEPKLAYWAFRSRSTSTSCRA